MIRPLIIEDILVDVYHNGIRQFIVNKFSLIDVRRQICEQNLEGYTLRINSRFWGLFDEDVNIKAFVVKLTPNGEIENEWFPEYQLINEYGYVGVYQETLEATKKLRQTQIEKNNIDE